MYLFIYWGWKSICHCKQEEANGHLRGAGFLLPSLYELQGLNSSNQSSVTSDISLVQNLKEFRVYLSIPKVFLMQSNFPAFLKNRCDCFKHGIVSFTSVPLSYAHAL